MRRNKTELKGDQKRGEKFKGQGSGEGDVTHVLRSRRRKERRTACGLHR